LSEFQNPQNQPGLDKRMMFVFAFTAVLLLLAQQFLVKPQQQLNEQTGKNAPTPATAVSSASAAPATPGATQPLAAKQAESENTTVVENDLYRITFTNRGGLVKSWILKKYRDDSSHELELVHR